MTHEKFKIKLNNLNINLKQFSELTNLPYSTVSKFGKSNPVPNWVEPFLTIYDENTKMKDIKSKIKEFASSL